jgi:hypothetical protein
MSESPGAGPRPPGGRENDDAIRTCTRPVTSGREGSFGSRAQGEQRDQSVQHARASWGPAREYKYSSRSDARRCSRSACHTGTRARSSRLLRSLELPLHSARDDFPQGRREVAPRLLLQTTLVPMELVHHKEFDASLQSMRKKGGENKRKADKVLQIVGGLNMALTALTELPVTKHGESRVKHCVKYELGNGYRLVTIQTEKVVMLCFAGTHDETDRWLDSHNGLTIAKGQSGAWEPVYKSPSVDAPLRRIPAAVSERLLERMDEARVDRLLEGVPASCIAKFYAFETLVTQQDIEAACRPIQSEPRRVLVHDVLCLLASGDRQSAESRLDLELGEVTDVDDLSADELLNVKDGDQVRRLRIGSAEYERWLKSFSRNAGAMEWLLFLHPEQSAVVEADFSGPAQLSGVSGSGKTCVAIHRAVRLALKDPSAHVLIVTLNRSLAGLIEKLVDAAAPSDDVRDRIVVSSFFQLCQQLLHEFEPGSEKQYADVTWKLDEHIDEVYREFYRCWVNNASAEVLLPLHHSLLAQGLCAETYVREEFDWIRSAVVAGEREKYLSLDRQGRRIPLLEDARSRLLDGLREWETKMREVGVVDYLGLTTALSAHIDKLSALFTHVIVDEAQDFGTSELRLLRALCADGNNDMFLCGDIAQHVLPKHRMLQEAGINTVGRSRRIVRNYRNSREILKAAYDILIENLDEGMLDSSDLEILDPLYASRSSNEPVVLSASSLEEEIGYARTLAAQHLATNPGHRCCIAFAGYSVHEVEGFAQRLGYRALRGEDGPLEDGLVFSDLEQTKGYEFNLVILVNCRDGVLPPAGTAPEETFRHGCRLYVAMTRARDELYLSYSGAASKWLNRESRSLSFMNWDDVIALDSSLMTPPPTPLRQMDGDAAAGVLSLKGRDFLYTPEARGLSLEAIKKIDELVDGVGLIRKQKRVRWRNMAILKDDLASQPSARLLFGPVVQAEIQERLKAIAAATRQ